MKHKKVATIFAAVAASALVAGLAGSARADIAYGYAEQTISNVMLTPASGSLGGVTIVNTSTTDGATVGGSGISNSDPVDAPQTYFGPSAPPENTFVRTAPGNPPSAASFTRGDVQIAGLGTGNPVGNVVSESMLNGTGNHSETGQSTLTATVTFTPSASGALTIKYNFANDLYAVATGGGSATASYNFDFTIKDSAGNIVFRYGSTPQSANTNLTLSAPPQGNEIIASGMDSVTTSSLNAGQTYTLAFSEKTATSVTLAAVPEPGPIALAAVAGGLAIATGAVRRFRRASK
jgi:hypothetical protein